jgi:hypothetical protein
VAAIVEIFEAARVQLTTLASGQPRFRLRKIIIHIRQQASHICSITEARPVYSSTGGGELIADALTGDLPPGFRTLVMKLDAIQGGQFLRACRKRAAVTTSTPHLTSAENPAAPHLW